MHRITVAKRWRMVVLVLIALGMSLPPARARDKTDLVTLINGDRITGEIVKLEYGQLEVKTDNLGTISIEWVGVRSIQSHYEFLVEDVGSGRSVGTPETGGPPGALWLRGENGLEQLPLVQVARMSQIDHGFWQRLDGSVSLGASFAKATNLLTENLAFNAQYRSERQVIGLDADFSGSHTPDAGSTNRTDVVYTQEFLRPQQRFLIGRLSFERNDELGINGRLQAAFGAGKYLHQTLNSEIQVYAGAAFSQEWVRNGEPNRQSIEGIAGLGWRIFHLASPETTLRTALTLYPSVSEFGRWRADLNSALRHEIIKNFFIELSFYGNYDSRPPDTYASTTDYSFITSLGYKF